jgi:hypothetical protein
MAKEQVCGETKSEVVRRSGCDAQPGAFGEWVASSVFNFGGFASSPALTYLRPMSSVFEFCLPIT